jgi:CO/xanthine dehydrogenase Mo-binding subunit
VRSPYAHARILCLKRDAARTMPGVVAVVTGGVLTAVWAAAAEAKG